MNDWNAKVIEEFRANGGKVGGNFDGLPLLILHTTGVRSGEERLNPLAYLELDGHRYVFASFAGSEHNPAWFHNLVAHPEVTVEVGTETYRAKATPLAADARLRVYGEQAKRVPVFSEYEQKTDRAIPVVELTPV